jgi:hypothetical protein
MQGYIRVSPADADIELSWSTGNTNEWLWSDGMKRQRMVSKYRTRSSVLFAKALFTQRLWQEIG